MGKLNKEWHLVHPMPTRPTIDQRVEWHIEHTKNCDCREMPEAIKAEIAARNKENKGIQIDNDSDYEVF